MDREWLAREAIKKQHDIWGGTGNCYAECKQVCEALSKMDEIK